MSGRKMTRRAEKRLRMVRRGIGMEDIPSSMPSKIEGDTLLVKGVNEKIYGIKVSAALLEVCQPMMDEFEGDDDAARRIIDWGVMAWNLAVVCVLEGEKAEDVLESLAKVFSEWDTETMMSFAAIVLPLVVRKRELFPQIDSYILHYEVEGSGGRFQLNVATAPYEASKAEEWKKECGKVIARREHAILKRGGDPM